MCLSLASAQDAPRALAVDPTALPVYSSTNTSGQAQQNNTIVNNTSLADLYKKQFHLKNKAKQKGNTVTDPNAPYDPSHPDYTKVYDISNKSYQPAVDFQDQHALLKLPVYKGKTFVNDAKPLNYGSYSGDQQSLYHDKTFPTPQAYPTSGSSDSKKGRTDYSKTFAVPAKPVYGDQSAYPTQEALAYNHKTYDGPEAQIAREEVKRVSQGMTGLKEIPNRPLSIEEVKNLLNRGHSPSQDSPDDSPEDDSPAKVRVGAPTEVPPPLDTHADDHATSDPQMPGPGEMAPAGKFQAIDPAAGAPATAEPLPQ